MSATSTAAPFRKFAGWSIVLSVLMISAGILAIASPLAAGLAVNIFVGWLLVFSGCFHLVFSWSRRTAGGSVWELLVGPLYVVIGGYLLIHLVRGLESLTIALTIYLFLEAVFEFALGFTLRPLPGSGWLIFDGIVTLILAVMIWRTWPSSAAWVIGLLVGISMLFSGTSRLVMSMAARNVTANRVRLRHDVRVVSPRHGGAAAGAWPKDGPPQIRVQPFRPYASLFRRPRIAEWEL